MTIVWAQLVSSRDKVPALFAALEDLYAKLKAPDATVMIEGTRVGGFADPYDAYLQLDSAELIRLVMEDGRKAPRDVYAARVNSLDPAVHGLREILDIPVLTLMEVGCPMAVSPGERFGVLVPNKKMIPQYQDVIARLGLSHRIAAMEAMPFDRILDYHGLFTGEPEVTAYTDKAVQIASERLVDQGAEVILATGPMDFYLSHKKACKAGGATYLDMLGLLLKVSEGVAVLARHGGLATSRKLRYQQPPAELYNDALDAYLC